MDKFKKYKITARKYGGDDLYSWAVFVNGQPRMTGLGINEVPYYKRQLLQYEIEKEESDRNAN